MFHVILLLLLNTWILLPEINLMYILVTRKEQAASFWVGKQTPAYSQEQTPHSFSSEETKKQTRAWSLLGVNENDRADFNEILLLLLTLRRLTGVSMSVSHLLLRSFRYEVNSWFAGRFFDMDTPTLPQGGKNINKWTQNYEWNLQEDTDQHKDLTLGITRDANTTMV